ncbi:hypothetical protein L9F63_015409, partial [Diploptera punctata]
TRLWVPSIGYNHNITCRRWETFTAGVAMMILKKIFMQFLVLRFSVIVSFQPVLQQGKGNFYYYYKNKVYRSVEIVKGAIWRVGEECDCAEYFIPNCTYFQLRFISFLIVLSFLSLIIIPATYIMNGFTITLHIRILHPLGIYKNFTGMIDVLNAIGNLRAIQNKTYFIGQKLRYNHLFLHDRFAPRHMLINIPHQRAEVVQLSF